MHEKPIQLLLITGFLGSGKTSAINDLIRQLNTKKLGLILNDFGSIVIDDALVEKGDEIIAYKNLSGGQIFCSCLSGSFVDSVEAMLPMHPDYIIVETSGLAKPAPMLEILSVISKRSEHTVQFSGMLCVIDADRFPVLFAALNTLEEQIMFSDWFLINKTDLVDTEAITSVSNSVSSLRPLAPVYPTTYGTLPEELRSLMLEGRDEQAISPKPDTTRFKGWGVFGRPKTCIFLPPEGFDTEQLHTALSRIAANMLRMKGFIPQSEDSSLLVSAVGPHLLLTEKQMPNSISPGVVCIHAANLDGPQLIRETWREVAGTEAVCYPA
jgi:G3E family GTPase